MIYKGGFGTHPSSFQLSQASSLDRAHALCKYVLAEGLTVL